MLEIIKKKQKQQSLPLIISNFERGITTIAKRQTKRDAKRERERKKSKLRIFHSNTKSELSNDPFGKS